MATSKTALTFVFALMCGPVLAGPDAPLDRLRTAHALYTIGLDQKQPLYILAAAKLRKSIALKRTGRAPAGGATASGAPLSWQDMLAAAAPLSQGDPMLVGLAEDIAAEGTKGVASGPVYSVVTIGAGASDKYPHLTFSGGQYAEIYVEGASGTDLNLLVHDARGRLVCSDTDISAIAYCGWHPATDGSFAITVKNDGKRGGKYSMMTN